MQNITYREKEVVVSLFYTDFVLQEHSYVCQLSKALIYMHSLTERNVSSI